MDIPADLGMARTLLEHIGGLGYVVEVAGGDGKVILTAVDLKTGETFTVRAPLADSYDAAVALAEQVGIDLMDG